MADDSRLSTTLCGTCRSQRGAGAGALGCLLCAGPVPPSRGLTGFHLIAKNSGRSIHF